MNAAPPITVSLRFSRLAIVGCGTIVEASVRCAQSGYPLAPITLELACEALKNGHAEVTLASIEEGERKAMLNLLPELAGNTALTLRLKVGTPRGVVTAEAVSSLPFTVLEKPASLSSLQISIGEKAFMGALFSDVQEAIRIGEIRDVNQLIGHVWEEAPWLEQELAWSGFPVPAGLEVGSLFDRRFRLLRPLGRGGMGVVWLAQDTRLDGKLMALKFLPEEVSHSPEAINDLRREVNRCLGLNHDHIIRVHDLIEAGGTAAISMEYVEGQTLDELRRSRPSRVLEAEDLSPLLPQICGAMAYAHGKGIIHRDIKPQNIMLTHDGMVKLCDFGLADSLVQTRSRLSGKRGHGASGTILYMSPQQLLGLNCQPQDDIYSLGATLYELLTSKPPFFSGAVERQIENTPPAPINKRRENLDIHKTPAVPANWNRVILQCLAKKREDRPQRVTKLPDMLHEVPTGRPGIKPVLAGVGLLLGGLYVGYAGLIKRSEPAKTAEAAQATTSESIQPQAALAPSTEAETKPQEKPPQAPTIMPAAPQPSPSQSKDMILVNLADRLAAEGRYAEALGELEKISEAGLREPKILRLAEDAARHYQARIDVLLKTDKMAEASRLVDEFDQVIPGQSRLKNGLQQSIQVGVDALKARWEKHLKSQEPEIVEFRKLISAARFEEAQQILKQLKQDLSDWPANLVSGYAPLEHELQMAREQDLRLRRTKAQEMIKQVNDRLKKEDSALAELETLLKEALRLDDEIETDNQYLKAKAAIAEARQPRTPTNASAKRPYVNSMGASFIPVPGKSFLAAQHETTVAQWRSYAASNTVAKIIAYIPSSSGGKLTPTRDGSWKSPGFKQSDDHPVVCISLADAEKFAAWLTHKERLNGQLTYGQTYRIPSSTEWSSLIQNVTEHTSGIRNLGSSSDAFRHTSPVGAFPARGGLFDLDGNVREWVLGTKPQGEVVFGVTRGGSWLQEANSDTLLLEETPAAVEHKNSPMGYADTGFRLVLHLD